MGFWKNVANSFALKSTSNSYYKIGQNYEWQRYSLVKDKFKTYINNLDELLKMFDKRKITTIDENGKKVKKYKDDILLLTKLTVDYYQYAEKEAKFYITTYNLDKDLKKHVDNVKRILDILYDIEIIIGTDFRENPYYTTANNYKLPNAVRWAKQRKKLKEKLNKMEKYYYKM